MPISFAKFLADYELHLHNYVLQHGTHPLFVYEARKSLDLDHLNVLGLALVSRGHARLKPIRDIEEKIARRAMGLDKS